jgi:hypothetical protein
MAKVKILKTGETDINSTDIWRFALHSDYPTSKIAISGSTTATILAGDMAINHPTGFIAIPHNLGYVPFCKVSVVRTSTSFSGTRVVRLCGNQVFYDETDVIGRGYSATADTENLYVEIYNTVETQVTTRTFTIHYIIQYDQE